MRTTLTLDDDLAQQIQELARQSGESFRGVVNQLLRSGLHKTEKLTSLPRFVVHPKACGFRSGVDPERLNRLSDELEIQDFARFPGLRWPSPIQ
jgi:hypothetical protein